MNLPGLITITPDQTELIERIGASVGTSFTEEPWTAVYLDALGGEEASERKLEVCRAMLAREVAHAARFAAAYATPDEASAAMGYLGSELRSFGVTWAQIEDDAHEELERNDLTAEEAELLMRRAGDMAPISYFGWGDEESAEMGYDDYLYFAMWAVDPAKRGSGAFRRLTTPFFDFADERGIPCYLECYNDNLRSLYEHIGFEIFRVLEDPAFDIKQLCMVRRPR